MGTSLRKRDFGLDLIRALAIMGVVVTHVSAQGLYGEVGNFTWWSSLAWSTVFRRNVILFLMCSGAVLLQPKRELSYKKLFTHNMLRLLVALLVWAMAYKVWHLWQDGTLNRVCLWEAFKQVLLFKHEMHLYYLQIMLLVYLFLPITRIVSTHATKQQLQYTLGVWCLFGILYTTVKPFWPFRLLGGIPAQYYISMTYSSIFYGLLGYYMKEYPISRRLSLGLMVFGLLFTILSTHLMSARQGYLYEHFLDEATIGPFCLGIGTFGLLCNIKAAPNRFVEQLCTQLSKGSMCIYLVHWGFLSIIPQLYQFPQIPYLVSIPLRSLVVLLISWAVWQVLHRIPVVKRYLV